MYLRCFTWALVIVAVCGQIARGGPAQDFLSFQTAAALVGKGAYSAIYPENDAASLFDVDPEFEQTALAVANNSIKPGQITANVGPPTAVLTGFLFLTRPEVATFIWRVLIAALGLASLSLLERELIRTEKQTAVVWCFVMIGSLPQLLNIVALGQTSILLLVAATATALSQSRIRGFLGGLALGLVSTVKVFPALMVPLAVVFKRRRLAWKALAIIISMTLVTIVFLPWRMWSDFAGSSLSIGTRVIADWNNASLDAGLAAIGEGRLSSSFVVPTVLARLLAFLGRALIIGAAFYLCLSRRRLSAERRWSVIWTALLASTPLLWNHYLVCLLPAVYLEVKSGRRVLPMLMTVALSAGVVAKGLIPLFAVSVLTVIGWLVVATIILVLAYKSLSKEKENTRPFQSAGV